MFRSGNPFEDIV
ncbi:hypothetical protein AYI69_g9981, partial [Smittium culicis]